MKIRYYHLDQVVSTNSWASEHAHEFALDELVAISASAQTSGRGRFEREWYSPRNKNLYLTLGLYLEAPKVRPFALCQLASLALEELLKSHGILAQIKWPNDLLVNGKKIVGILTERHEVNGHQFMSIGIGLNVNMTADELVNIPQKATSMLIEQDRPFDLQAICQQYVALFAKKLEEAIKEGFDEILRHWQKSLDWMLQLPINVKTAEKQLKGKVIDLQPEGNITLELPDGTKEEIDSPL
jgi:BirA family biotin operon repressor/biotin-[acetyl-CoA-carboxylase] ligase